jgi:hypothetical protein
MEIFIAVLLKNITESMEMIPQSKPLVGRRKTSPETLLKCQEMIGANCATKSAISEGVAGHQRARTKHRKVEKH